MADKQSRLAEIYKAEKAKGGGVLSTLGKRAKEKFDPRQMFNQKGFAAAVLPSVFKAYDATDKQGKVKQLSEENKQASVSSAALESGLGTLISETRELTIHSKLAAKNSIVLPSMARDMNVMRQNIGKLVKLQGGTATTKADMFFKRAGDREAAYESKFKKASDTSPTKAGTAPKEEEKKGILGSIIDGISSLFTMKGALIAGILAAITLGIKEYFTNDEFKTKVDSFLGDMFTTIKNYFMEKLPVIIDFMKDHWKELALAFALLFPKTTMDLIAGGLNILSSGLNLLASAVKVLLPLIEVTLVTAFRSLIALLTGPAGLIILLGGALFAARKLFDQNQEEYLKLAKEKKEKGTLSEKDEARLKELNSPTNEAAAEKQLGYNPISGKLVTQQEANRSMAQRSLDSRTTDNQLKDIATEQLIDEATKAGKDPNNITNKDIETRFQLLKKQRDSQNAKESAQKTAAAPNQSDAETSRLAASGKPTLVTPPSVSKSSSSPTPTATSQTPTNAEPLKVKKLSKEQSEMATLIYNKFTAAGFNDAQATAAVVNSFAESSLNPKSESRKTDKEASYGLFQMNTKGGLGAGHDPEKLKDPNYNIDLMIQAAKGKAGGKFRSTTTVEDAITAFTKDLERPANADAEAAKRVALASAITNYTPTTSTQLASNSPEKTKESPEEPKLSPMEQIFNSMLATAGIDVAKVSSDVKDSAGKINQATTQVAEAKNSKSESSIVNNVTNNNVNNSTSGGGSSASTASVYDDLFAKLVQRALA